MRIWNSRLSKVPHSASDSGVLKKLVSGSVFLGEFSDGSQASYARLKLLSIFQIILDPPALNHQARLGRFVA